MGARVANDALKRFPFGVVILGAGAGTRFGQPKAEATLEPGVRFLDRVVAVAQEAGADAIIAVLPKGGSAPAPARTVTGNPSTEQISSLRLGLMQLANTSCVAALVWPVDHPYVNVASVSAILDAYARNEAPIVVPTLKGRRGHPGLFARHCWREIMTVEQGGARAVVQAYGTRVEEVPVPSDGVVRNIDRPTDMQRSGEPDDVVS